ncbi:MAG: exosortase/archaeosortase family protein [Chthoniobacterales bacterium]
MTKAAISDAQPARVQPDAERTGKGLFAAALFLLLIWIEVISQLRSEWSYNTQYRFGWSVPFLAVYLFWKRWLIRPVPGESRARNAIYLLVLGAILIIPLRLVAEANPDWRLLSWSMAAIAVTATLILTYLIGGQPWLRHFAFPIIFFCVAVPWPVQFEQAVIQGLMRAVTSINVFFLSVAGIPALQHGNVIEVRSGLIGIEEACSGVRSLQATLMVSLFLGEFYFFPARRRILLVAAGALLAFGCNLIRTAMLVWIGAKHGAGAIEAWHDPAGLTILLVCLFGLWGLSLLMQQPIADLTEGGSSSRARFGLLPTAMLGALCIWIIAGECGIRAWYHSHQSGIAGTKWHAVWPQTEHSYKPVEIPEATRGILRYDDGGGATWNGSDVHHWMMYFFRWLPGRTAALFVKIHRPDVCLPASGLTLRRDDGVQLLNVDGVKLPVRFYRFDDRGVPLHVVYCYWDARSSYESTAAATEEDWSAAGRIKAAMRGRREIGAQMLELIVWGYDDDSEARAALTTQLQQIVKPG